MKESTKRAERDLYPGVKKALVTYLHQGDDHHSTLLEVTADRFPEHMKGPQLVQDDLLFLLDSRETRPDLFGHIGPDCTDVYGASTFVLTAEVKDGPPTINDVFQAKKYGDIYWAHVALLVATELPEERIRRLLVARPDLLSYGAGTWSLYLCHYSESTGTIDWWLEKREPRKK